MSSLLSHDPNTALRQRRLSDLARAEAGVLAGLWHDFASRRTIPEHSALRGPEIGTVMVQGRVGAVGSAFNLGEMSVTRMSVLLPCGSVGHGHVQGRDKESARIVALLDALAEAGEAEAVEAEVLAPLRAARQVAAERRAAKAAATKVEFFTMVRGDA